MRRRLSPTVRRLHAELRRGDVTAANNLAVAYRMAGNRRRAYFWWTRAAGPHDGDAWLEVGFCLHYGIGVRRDAAAAIRAYRRAIASCYVSAYGREEAQYHLAVALIDRGRPGDYDAAVGWLRRAAADGDYRQAALLIGHLRSPDNYEVCRCRRGLLHRYGGTVACALHRPSRTADRRAQAEGR